MYSRYEGKGNGSSVYMVKTGVRRVLSEHVDAYPYTGGIIGNDAEDHLEYEPAPEALAEMKLTPYTGLDSEPLIRYLYTGREYNIETGDYYYRYRMMEAGIGRFLGKDIILYLNLYRYVKNNPNINIDPMGMYAQYPGTHKPFYTYGKFQIIISYIGSLRFIINLLEAYVTMRGGTGAVVDTAPTPPPSGGPNNYQYMKDINKCDKQESNCRNCCEGEYTGCNGAKDTCDTNCALSAGECKKQVDKKYGVSNSTNLINIPELWGNSGLGWNCWDNSEVITNTKE